MDGIEQETGRLVKVGAESLVISLKSTCEAKGAADMKIVKVTITKENGDPICTEAGKDAYLLTDKSPILIARKNGGTVETVCGDITALLEFTARQMKTLGVQQRRELSGIFERELHSS